MFRGKSKRILLSPAVMVLHTLFLYKSFVVKLFCLLPNLTFICPKSRSPFFLFNQSFLSDMVILGGNMRYKACKEAGLKEIPIIITDLSEDKQREFLIKDNTSGGEWDWEVLANEWDNEELEAWGLDIPNEKRKDIDAEEDDFDVVLPQEPKTVLGDVYEIGIHRLICGDSTQTDTFENLMSGELADLVVTDPPYNVAC